MATAVNVHEEAERIANEVFGALPTAEQIDEKARAYQGAKAEAANAAAAVKALEDELIAWVKMWGFVPPHAEKSRRLNGRLAELTLTKSDTITILDDRVEDLKLALWTNGRQAFFEKLFAVRSKYEMVEGAEAALKSYPLPKRLAERVLNMFGRCFDIKPRKASLKVDISDPAKPAKPARKPRAKKSESPAAAPCGGGEKKEAAQ